MAIAAPIQQGTTRKVFHRTKADWAAANAADIRSQAYALHAKRACVPGMGPRTRSDDISALHREAAKFDRMAAAFRRKGL